MKSPKAPRTSYTTFPYYERIHGPRPVSTPTAQALPAAANPKVPASAAPTVDTVAATGQSSRPLAQATGLVAVLAAIRGRQQPVARTLTKVLHQAQKSQAKDDKRKAASTPLGLPPDSYCED